VPTIHPTAFAKLYSFLPPQRDAHLLIEGVIAAAGTVLIERLKKGKK
jgi:hypothetical protein